MVLYSSYKTDEIKILIKINIYPKNKKYIVINVLRTHSEEQTLKTMLWNLLTCMYSNYCCLKNNSDIHF